MQRAGVLLLLFLCSPLGSLGSSPQLLSRPSEPHKDDLQELFTKDYWGETLWNITHKYNTYSPSNVNVSCVPEVQGQLASLYLINITLQESLDFLKEYWSLDYLDYDGSEISHAHEMYRNRTTVLQDLQLYQATILVVLKDLGLDRDQGGELLCVQDSPCKCVSKKVLDRFDQRVDSFRDLRDCLQDFINFGTYLDPVFRILILIVGLVLNGAVILIFVKEKAMRTESQILIFNMIVNNIFTLVVFLPTNYVRTYHLYSFYRSNFNNAVQVIVVSVNTTLVLLLAIQRYFAVSKVVGPASECWKMTPVNRCTLYTCVLWGWSLLVGTLLGVVEADVSHALEAMLYFFLYLILFSVATAVIGSMTSRKLLHAIQQGRRIEEFVNMTGPGMINSLTVAYYTTHVLFFMYRIVDLGVTVGAYEYFTPLFLRIIVFSIIINFLSFPCLSVFALYRSSSVYRTYLRKYLFRCWHLPEEGQYVNMSSVQESEAGG